MPAECVRCTWFPMYGGDFGIARCTPEKTAIKTHEGGTCPAAAAHPTKDGNQRAHQLHRELMTSTGKWFPDLKRARHQNRSRLPLPHCRNYSWASQAMKAKKGAPPPGRKPPLWIQFKWFEWQGRNEASQRAENGCRVWCCWLAPIYQKWCARFERVHHQRGSENEMSLNSFAQHMPSSCKNFLETCVGNGRACHD